ncbi:MAG TPA: S8 family serine peptidase [Saprospiraceae bacterium]|nr:S8 family serine peptidase [Saprospiraceae bacterium]
MKKSFLILPIILLMTLTLLVAQEQPPKNWFHLDPVLDSFTGVSTDRTYQQLLKGRKSTPIIVAVLDSGVDYEHEDLKNVMWINPGEIPGNGIDDDGNGYIDDVYGWNFIGGKDGQNVYHDTYEVTRLYKQLRPKYEDRNPASISKKEKKEYEKYLEYKKVIEDKLEELPPNVALYEATYNAIEALAKAIGKKPITLDDLKKFKSTDQMMMSAANLMINLMSSEGQSFENIQAEVKSAYDYYNNQLTYGYNEYFDPRPIIGDNIDDPYERYYGNNDVRGPDAEHGTHVAGIIAAERNNGIGMDGVASNVRIMSVRTVPDGDERDKDVANAIIYAVDNGAAVINMSFGKGASPDKPAVDKALRYARKKDVLIVHAAGNDAKENNGTNNFPNKKFKKKGLFGPKYADNWLEIGALNWQRGEKAAASFSNYSPQYVDLFAPGTAIYSTIPGSEYKNLQGTSMAAPVAAGVAATLRSYFPELTAKQVKDIMMKSVIPVSGKVKKPGSDELVNFNRLSVSGGVVNMYQAVELARQTKGKRKIAWPTRHVKPEPKVLP